MLEPEKEITCPFCQSNEVVVVDIIADNNPPFPTFSRWIVKDVVAQVAAIRIVKAGKLIGMKS